MFELIRRAVKKVLYKKLLSVLASVLCLVFGVNFLLSGMTLVVFTHRTDVRVRGEQVLADENITKENSAYEGYTPLSPPGLEGINPWDCFEIQGDKLVVKSEYKKYQYYIMSSSHYRRFKAEPERYAEQLAYYDMLEEQYDRVISLEGFEYETHIYGIEFVNIKKNLEFLKDTERLTGYSTFVYAID